MNSMSDQDKETIELMIENKLQEKLHPLDKKLDKVLDNMELFSEWQKKTDTKVTEIADQTSIWRWMQRKPKRFSIILVLVWLTSIYEVRVAIGNAFKTASSFLNF